MHVTIHQIANQRWTLIWIWRVILISRFGSVQCHAIYMNNHILFLNSTDTCSIHANENDVPHCSLMVDSQSLVSRPSLLSCPSVSNTVWNILDEFQRSEADWTRCTKPQWKNPNWVSIDSGDGFSPVRRQSITWTSADLRSIGHFGTNSIFKILLNLNYSKIPYSYLTCIWSRNVLARQFRIR